MSNFGGSVLVWKITDLLDEDPEEVIEANDTNTDYFVEEWLAPLSISDDLDNNVWHVAAVNEVWHDGENPRDEVYLYTMVGRYGIAVLRFDPGAQPGSRLSQIDYIRIPSGMGGLRIIRDEENDPRTLIVNESTNGLRTFVYPQ